MQSKKHSFKIENFEPKELKKSNTILDKHLKSVEKYLTTNHLYEQSIVKENLWKKIKRMLHID